MTGPAESPSERLSQLQVGYGSFEALNSMPAIPV